MTLQNSAESMTRLNPLPKQIYRWIKAFVATDTINNLRKKSLAVKVVRKPKVRSPEKIVYGIIGPYHGDRLTHSESQIDNFHCTNG